MSEKRTNNGDSNGNRIENERTKKKKQQPSHRLKKRIKSTTLNEQQQKLTQPRKILNAIIFDRSYWHSHANILVQCEYTSHTRTPFNRQPFSGFSTRCAFFSVRTRFSPLFLSPENFKLLSRYIFRRVFSFSFSFCFRLFFSFSLVS